MLKRNLCLCALGSTLAFTSFAHEFAFGAGVINTNMHSLFTYEETGEPRSHINASNSAISGEFYIGYAYNINKGFDIAAEIFYELGGPDVEQVIATPGFVTHSSTNSYGVRILPGFNITPSTRVFAEVGYVALSTEINLKNTTTTTAFESQSSEKRGWALAYGAGLETMFYESVGLRASYVVMDPSATASITSIDETVTYEAEPAIQVFYLGGILRFKF